MAMGRPFDLPYSVELWDDNDSHVEELIALTGDYRAARAAYEEAVKRRPGRLRSSKRSGCWRIVVAEISTSVPARTNRRREEAALR